MSKPNDYMKMPLQDDKLMKTRISGIDSRRGRVDVVYASLQHLFDDAPDGKIYMMEIQTAYIDKCKELKRVTWSHTFFCKIIKQLADDKVLNKEYRRKGDDSRGSGRWCVYMKGENFDAFKPEDSYLSKRKYTNWMIRGRRCFGQYDRKSRFCRDICGVRKDCSNIYATKKKGAD